MNTKGHALVGGLVSPPLVLLVRYKFSSSSNSSKVVHTFVHRYHAAM